MSKSETTEDLFSEGSDWFAATYPVRMNNQVVSGGLCRPTAQRFTITSVGYVTAAETTRYYWFREMDDDY